MTSAPRITILLPTYEPQETHLKGALDSLLAQTEQEWALFIHDDASEVDVRAMVEPYLSDSRITFERSEKRLGIGGNWNTCLKYGNASFIQFLFQDDTWHPEYLSTALKIMDDHPDVGFASLHHRYECEDGIETAPLYENLFDLKSEFRSGFHQGKQLLHWWMERGLHPNIIGEPSFVMLRRSIVENVGYFCEDMPQFLDVEYWIRMLAHTNWYFHREPLGAFRVHHESASAQNFEEGNGLFDRFHCLERLATILPPEEKQHVQNALRNQFDGMVEKFFNRAKKKQGIRLKGSGSLKWFCMKHPFLVSRSIAKYVCSKGM